MQPLAGHGLDWTNLIQERCICIRRNWQTWLCKKTIVSLQAIVCVNRADLYSISQAFKATCQKALDAVLLPL